MTQIGITAQDLYNDTKCFVRVNNKDDLYAMAAIKQYFEPHKNILWKLESSTLALYFEEKIICRQQY